MRKIIVQFKNETLCFMGGSCEGWLEGFVKALHDAQKLEAKESELYKGWWSQRPHTFVDDELLQEWMGQKPRLEWDHAGMFNYCGQDFDISDFIDSDMPAEKDTTLPLVWYLEDWFNLSCVNPEE